MCVITYLFSNENYLCKQFIKHDNEISLISYDRGYLLMNDTIQYQNLFEAYYDIRELAKSRRFCFIRGNVKPEYQNKPCRRLLYDNPEKGTKATIQLDAIGKHLIMLDFDDVDNPAAIQPTVTDIERLIVARLPPEFHNSSFFYQFSSSAGVYGWNPFKIHLFYWTTTPWPDADLRDWAKAWNEKIGSKWLDDRVMLSSQINYIADPLFVGMDDPLGDDRWDFVKKTNDTVDLQAIVRTGRPASSWIASLATVHTPAEIQARLEEKLAQIGVGGNYREPLMAAIGFYIAASKRHGLLPNHEYLKSTIQEHAGGVLDAGGRGEYLTGRHLDDLIDWYDAHLAVVEYTEAEKAAWKSRSDRQRLMQKFKSFNKSI